MLDLHYYLTDLATSPAQAWEDYILALPSLVGFWRLGEPSGTTATDEQGTANGTYYGTPTLGAVGSITGDTAMTVNGTDQFMRVPDNAAWSPTTTGELTVIIAAYPDGAANNSFLISKGTDAQFEWEIERDNDGSTEGFTARLRQADGTTIATAVYQGATGWEDGSWYLVGMTVDTVGQVLDLWAGKAGGGFVKGTDTTWVGSMTNGTSEIEVGRRRDNTGDFTGTLDEVIICSAKLTDAVMGEVFTKWDAA